MVAVFEAEAVEVQSQGEQFAEQGQEKDVEEQGEDVVLPLHPESQIAQQAGPAGGQQEGHHQQSETAFRQAKPATEPVVAPGVGRIGRE